MIILCSVSAVASLVKDLVTDLERKACTALDWLDANKLIANPEKFKANIAKIKISKSSRCQNSDQRPRSCSSRRGGTFRY